MPQVLAAIERTRSSLARSRLRGRRPARNGQGQSDKESDIGKEMKQQKLAGCFAPVKKSASRNSLILRFAAISRTTLRHPKTWQRVHRKYRPGEQSQDVPKNEVQRE